MGEPDNLTRAIAIYGAVLSSFTFLWGVYRDRRDKGQLRVQAYVGKYVSAGPFKSPDEQYDHLCVNLTNVGRRQIKVESLGGRSERHWLGGDIHYWISPRNLPRMLPEGDSILETYPLDERLRSNLLQSITFGARDSHGRSYDLTPFQFRKLKKSLLTATMIPSNETDRSKKNAKI